MFVEHLLSCLLEVATSVVVKLLFCHVGAALSQSHLGVHFLWLILIITICVRIVQIIVIGANTLGLLLSRSESVSVDGCVGNATTGKSSGSLGWVSAGRGL